MASSFICDCGKQIRKNLFSGNHVALLVDEELLDRQPPPTSVDELIRSIVMTSPKVLRCDACDRLYVGDPFDAAGTRVYRLEDPSPGNKS